MPVHPLLRALVDAAGAGDGDESQLDPVARSSSSYSRTNDRPKGDGRPPGSQAERRAQHVCREVLARAGFEVIERSFVYSAWPGRFATPVAGVLLLVGALVIWWGTRGGSIDLPLTIGSAFLTIAAVGGAAAVEYGTSTFLLDRRTGVNIEARRGTPRIWLVAHIDSKSQTIPMLLRIASIVVCGIAWSVILTLWMTTFLLRLPARAFVPCALVAAIAAVPLALTFVSNRSAGALDNATGVATLLAAIARLDPTIPVGVLITSAEELGLAGARAWVEGKEMGIAINVDSIDDRGGWRCMLSHDDERATLRTAIRGATDSWHDPVTVRGVLPGVLVDAVAFKDAGWPAMTISRGTLGSLARIHTSRDTLTHCSGEGIDRAADLVVRIVGAIIARSEVPKE